MKAISNILLKVLGILLLTAALLKAYQLLNEPTANNDIWTNRSFLILTVEFELALGIWLLSGLFKKLAWLTTLVCFSLFSCITLYKGLSGADSCGCFGSVKVNPWITLFTVDIPACLALIIFRIKEGNLFIWPSLPRFAITGLISLVILTTAGCVLGFKKPAKSTSSYEVLEPQTWIGKELPILKYIDISDQLKKGSWLILFYHYDCPDCRKAIAKYEKILETDINNFIVRIAFIEVPPYGPKLACQNQLYAIGKLNGLKEWFITTPATVLLKDGVVTHTWEQQITNESNILDNINVESNNTSY